MLRLSDMKIITKVAVPLVIVGAVASGLVYKAHTTFNELNAKTQEIVDVQATRLRNILSIRIGVNEAAVQARNTILEPRVSEREKFNKRFDIAVRETFEAVDQNLALATTPERKAAVGKIRQAMEEYVAVAARSNKAGLAGDDASAAKILLGEGSAAREKVRIAVQDRIDVLTRELANAKQDAHSKVESATQVLVALAVVGLLAALGLALGIALFRDRAPEHEARLGPATYGGRRHQRRHQRGVPPRRDRSHWQGGRGHQGPGGAEGGRASRDQAHR